MHNRCWYLLSKKLSGNATDAELSELDELLMQNAEWQYAVQQITSVWQHNPVQCAEEFDFSSHVQRMENLGHDISLFNEPGLFAIHPSLTPSRRKWVAGTVLASLFITIVCWIFFAQKKPTAITDNFAVHTNTIATKSGSRTKMVLPDGSQVWLNAESKLEYNPGFGKSNRDVKLSGEAYFDVVKNVGMPFTIQTNKIHIKVTGTAFNVKAYPGEKVCETSLIRGKVEVTVNARPDEKYILKPNEKLVVRDEMAPAPANKAVIPVTDKKLANEPVIQLGYLNYVENDSAAIETSWVYNRLIFDDESFSDIATKMERWYGVKINLNDANIASQHLTYTIKNETIAQALHNMQYALRFRYAIEGENITITK